MEGLECPMLLFRERPDEVFYDIVRESLAGLAEDLKPAEVDPKLMGALLPKTAKMLSGGEALATVDELILALASPEVFELAPMHRLILSEALERYCESYNNHPQDTDVHARLRDSSARFRTNDQYVYPAVWRGFQRGAGPGPHGSAATVNSWDASSRPPTRRDLSLWYLKEAVYPMPPPEM